MDVKDTIQKIIDFGLSISFIARKANKNETTIRKWLKGETNISPTLQNDLTKIAEELNEEWQAIFK